MARIGLLEISARNHEISASCKMSNTKKNSVTVFTTNEMFPQIKEELHGKIEPYEWIFNKKNESNYKYLKRIEKICNERIDILIINTYRIWEFFFFKPRCKSLAVTSELNFWFRDVRNILIWLKKMKNIKHLLNPNIVTNPISGVFVRNIMLSHLDGVIVEYPPFKSYIKENFNYKGNIYFFPNRPFEGKAEKTKPLTNRRIVFVVPGRIERSRRDYLIVLNVFKKLFEKYNNSIELHLIGEPVGNYGKEIVQSCRNLKNKGYPIFFPEEDGYVSAEIFEKTLNKADIIISPLTLRFAYSTVEEFYTITKGTGIFSDIIKYAKPAIVPYGYSLTKEIETSFLTYKNENHLENLIEELIKDKKRLDEIKKEAIKTSEIFSLKNLNDAFDSMVEDLLSKQ